MAGDTANLTVTGTISPAVCGVSLGSGSTVQLGTIKLSDFKPGVDLALDDKDAALTITCEGAAAQVRLRATDPLGNPGEESAQYSLGYNEQSGERRSNGYFELSIDAASMPSNAFVLKSTDDGAGQAWEQLGSKRIPFSHDGEAFAFAATGGATEPASVETLTVPLKIKASLTKDPVVNEDIALAGQATIEILY
jgi:hypothetical protein